MAVRRRRPPIGGLGVDRVAAGERRAPAVVVEGTGEVVGAGGAVALGAVVGVVEVQLGLVAAEAVVVGAADRRVIVDAGADRLAVAALDQPRRHLAGEGVAGAVAPHAVGLLIGEERMELGAGRARRQRHDVADLRCELRPALMGEDLARRPALHRATAGDRVEVRVGALAAVVGEVGMIGQPLGGGVVEPGRIVAIAVGPGRHRDRRLQPEPRQRLGELQCPVERASRRAGRHRGVGAARERAQAVLARQHAARGEEAPLDELAPRHLSERTRLDDLRPVVTRPLRFELPDA